jgi:hypothetical protein
MMQVASSQISHGDQVEDGWVDMMAALDPATSTFPFSLY